MNVEDLLGDVVRDLDSVLAALGSLGEGFATIASREDPLLREHIAALRPAAPPPSRCR